MDWTKQAGSMAENYQGFLVPGMFIPCAEIVLDAAGVAAGDDVLDVACGTGAMSRAVAARAGAEGSVLGVDLSPPMLEVARGLGSPDGGAAIDYREGDADALPVDDAAFDAAVCQHGFQFFPDRPAALAEFRRALRPGGTVAIACWTRLDDSPHFGTMAQVLRDLAGDEAAAAMRMPFAVGADELGQLLSDAGFEDVSASVTEVRTDFEGTPVEAAQRAVLAGPVAPAFMAMPDADRATFVERVAAALAPYAEGGRLHPPMFTAIGTART